MLVIVDSGDLCINNIADGQDILGLADAAVGDLEMWIRPSAPGRTSANAPKGMSLTAVTGATSPTPYLLTNCSQGLPLGSLVAKEILRFSLSKEMA